MGLLGMATAKFGCGLQAAEPVVQLAEEEVDIRQI